MKKLQTKKQKEKKGRLNQLILGIALIALMLFSVLGYALSGNSENTIETIEYNGIEFIESGGYWYFNYNGNNFNTLYNPKELSDIPVLTTISLSDYNQKPLYFVGEISEPALEIIRNLNSFFLRVNSACLPDTNCTDDVPIKDPLIDKTDNIIIIQEPIENQKENIFQQENAVFITASYANQTKYADAFLFKVLGIN